MHTTSIVPVTVVQIEINSITVHPWLIIVLVISHNNVNL